MLDGIDVQLLLAVLLVLIESLSVVTLYLISKNKSKVAIILAIIIGLLSIVGVWVMLSHGLFSYRYNIIPKKLKIRE